MTHDRTPKGITDSELIAALEAAGGVSERAAVALGCDPANVSRRKRKLIKRGLWDVQRDIDRMIPDGYGIKRRSQLIDQDGNQKLEWLISEPDKLRQAELLAEAIENATSGIKPYERIPAPRKDIQKDLLTVYTITDYHLGMYAWEDEAGANWDMKIAEDLLMRKFTEMLDGSPSSGVGIFVQLGDLCHWDGLLAVTPANKNVLDADTRFPLLAQTAIRCMIWCVEMMARKHKQVHCVMAEGNHDPASSVWLRAMLANTFRKNPRITVEQSPHPYYAFEWGVTMLAWHHGHLAKMSDLPGVFAADPKFREMWGRAKHTSIHTGHKHHERVIERGGAIVEQHPTLAARDSHGSRLFEYSRRAAKAITFHKERGEQSRVIVMP